MKMLFIASLLDLGKIYDTIELFMCYMNATLHTFVENRFNFVCNIFIIYLWAFPKTWGMFYYFKWSWGIVTHLTFIETTSIYESQVGGNRDE